MSSESDTVAYEPDPVADNRVLLRGRLPEAVTEKILPSGDTLAVFRLTVPRPPGERVRVDSLECTTTRARLRRTLSRAAPGSVLEIEGSLRRRFWRSPAGPSSRYAVDVDAVRVVRRASAPPPARRARSGRAGAASPARTRASA